jgi:hypothetical protein
MTADTNFGNIELPIVTVFGAGIAGLTTAHELVERGFQVQVVEPTPSPTCEYECAVGGLAANQFSRVRAPLQVLHPWLMTNNTLNLGYALAFRDWKDKIEATAKRYPLNQKLRFDRHRHRPVSLGGPVMDLTSLIDAHRTLPDAAIRSHREPKGPTPEDWTQYWDPYGVLNRTKLDDVFHTIRRASRHYMRQYFPAFAAALDKDPNLQPQQQPGGWAPYTNVRWPSDDIKDCGDPKAINESANEAARNFIARETFFVRIVAYTDADSTQEENRELAYYWASQVYRELIRRNTSRHDSLRSAADNADAFLDPPIWELERRLQIVVRGAADARPTSDPRQRSLQNRVEFEIVEQMIPGEHGFRFFPGFYRHVFDTMQRTAILDERGAVQGTAFDQLVRTPHPQLSLEGGLYDCDFRKFSSISQMRRALDLILVKIGFRPTDLLGLEVKTFRFLLSGPKRRESQTETINFFEYIGGERPEKLYTQACLDFVDRAPRALAAMSASESDARTQYSVAIQLGLPNLPDPSTLNGPTSIAWLDPWKAYLKRQGVKFFVGRLADLTPATWLGEPTPRLVPVTQGPHPSQDKDGNPIPSDPVPENPDDDFRRPNPKSGFQHRFVLAAQLQDSSDIAWKARAHVLAAGGPFEGPFAQMVAFDTLTGRRKPGDAKARLPERDAANGKEPPTWPTRTISGAQFFFPQSYRFGRSNVYFSFTPYALTSISQYAFWRDHSGPVGQLLGQISIDIGDWHSPFPLADPKAKIGPGHPAFYSSSQEVAQGTWAQVASGLPEAYANIIQPPAYYHLDQNMVFRETEYSTQEPGWLITGGVRANAILRVPNNHNPQASVALVPGRAYWAEVRVGQAGDPITTGPVKHDPGAAITLRDALYDDLVIQAAGRLVLAKSNDVDIVVSPIASLKSATLRVLKGAAGAPFRLVLEGLDMSVPDGDPAAVIEALAVELDKQARDVVTVARPAPDYLTLTPLKGDTIRVGVLNAQRRIELVGAPSLIVKALNLEVPEPEEGFALIRNDYQYIINIPGQWGARPGLRREAGAIPEDFVKLAQAFGVKRPEIYYAHPQTCPLLEYWVGAGAHMATYTRMTTMEAANESGRHAAAALIYDLHAAAKRNHLLHYEALAGDFPTIYPVEDNEVDDLDMFKKLDDVLFDMGQPHLFEVIGLTQLVESLQAGDSSLLQIQAKLTPLLASLPGLQIAAPGFAAKLAGLILRMWPKGG